MTVSRDDGLGQALERPTNMASAMHLVAHDDLAPL